MATHGDAEQRQAATAGPEDGSPSHAPPDPLSTHDVTTGQDDLVALADVWHFLREHRSWGRWGQEDEKGAVNLITAEKHQQAASLVRTGRTISLSRPFPLDPAPNNPAPAQRYTSVVARAPGAASAVDYLGISTHGTACTHIDALCHMWDRDGMWNGRDAAETITPDGTRFGGVEAFGDGIVTRGVLLDVPRHRGVPYVTQDRPVTGAELQAITLAQGVTVEPGDAVVVHAGRDRWDADNGAWGAGSLDVATSRRPGLHVSCLRFLRDVDASLLVWDMMDARPAAVDIAFAVHAAIWAFGIPLVDNALLGPLAEVCAAEARWEFMLCVAPLPIQGATGSPVNPIALL
jgi:kynurenine formamidase